MGAKIRKKGATKNRRKTVRLKRWAHHETVKLMMGMMEALTMQERKTKGVITSVEVNTKNLRSAPQNGTDRLVQKGEGDGMGFKGNESTARDAAEDQSKKTDSGLTDRQSSSGETPFRTDDGGVASSGEVKDSSGNSEFDGVKLEAQTPENTNAPAKEM